MNFNFAVKFIDRLPRKKLERWRTILQILLIVFQILKFILTVAVLIRRA